MNSSPTRKEGVEPAPSELTAVEKHACPACGAQAEWQPGRQILACPFCGTESPHEVDRQTGQILEIDLVKTLREMPASLRGWEIETRTVRCRSCEAVTVFELGRLGQNCEFCGSPEIVDYDEVKAPIRPQSVLPFKLDEPRVRESIKRWYAKKWLAPNRLRKNAEIDTVSGVYLPYWTFDAQAHCPWSADSGTYYYTTESYTDKDGNRKTRRKRHTRWTPASGYVEHFFDDTPVPGTRGADLKLLRRIEPFPSSALVPYDTAFLSGFVVEHYQVVLIDAAEQSRQAMAAQLRSLCAAQVPPPISPCRDLRRQNPEEGEVHRAAG